MYPGRYAVTHPDRPAVHEAATGRTITYRELEEASVRFAHWLRARDVGVGDHVAVITVNDATVYELYWGALRSGVYITFVNSHLASAEAAYIVDDCDAKILLVSAPLAALAEEIVASTPKVEHRVAFGGSIPGHLDYETEVEGLSTVPPADQPRGSDMLYSSGTTGAPKGSSHASAVCRSTRIPGSRSSICCGTSDSTRTPSTCRPRPSTTRRRCATACSHRDGRHRRSDGTLRRGGVA